jgi:hypothetical protein
VISRPHYSEAAVLIEEDEAVIRLRRSLVNARSFSAMTQAPNLMHHRLRTLVTPVQACGQAELASTATTFPNTKIPQQCMIVSK